MLKVQTEKEWFGIWGFSLHTKKKKTVNPVFAFINGRLQRCWLGVYSVKSMRMESVFMVFHTSTVKRSTLDESYVDSTVTSIHVLETPYL